MKQNKESFVSSEPELKPEMPLDLENKYKLQNLERQVKKLETTVNTLTAICDIYAKANGIKVEQYKNLVVISQI